jgi:signal transduction histidine kinase
MFQKCFYTLILLLVSQVYFAQPSKKIDSFISEIDSIHDDQLAFEKLDSLLKTKSLSKKALLKVKEKIVLRSLNIQRYEVLNKNCYEGIELAKALKNDSAHAFFQKLLAFPYYFHKDYKKAILALDKSLSILEGKNYPQIEASIYNNLGGTYVDMNNLGMGKKMLLKSLEIHEKANLEGTRNYFLTKRILGSLYVRQNDYNAGLKLYNEVLDFAIAQKDTSLWSSALMFRSDALRSKGEKNKALKDSQDALDLMKIYEDKHSLIANYIFHANNLSAVGKHKEAYIQVLELYNTSVDIYNEETQLQLNELETKYKTKEIEEKNKLEQAKNKTLKKEIQLYISLIASVISLILVVILVVYIRNQRKRIKFQRYLQEQRLEAIIVGEEQEKSRIARELHDGIVQELSALNLQLSLLKNNLPLEYSEKISPFISKLKQSTDEVRSISYQLMPVTLKELGLEKAIEDLFERNFLPHEIDFDIHIHQLEERLPERVEITVFRICQELINNTVKHSKATFVSLLLRVQDSHLQVLYEDNGKGFDINSIQKGIGLNSLHSRLELIKGELKIDSSIGSGTHVFLKIPLNT